MAFNKHHGIEIAQNAHIKNLVVESLATDPVSVPGAGRTWFNTSSKTWKFSTLDAGGGVIVRTFNTKEEYDAYVSQLAASTAGDGSNLVGYEGATGSNGQFSITAGSVKAALDALTSEVDSSAQAISDIGTGSLADIQTEIDTSQTGAGLETDGQYVADGTTNYITTATSLKNADKLIDAQVKVNADALAQEVTDRTTADSTIQSELDASQLGAGLSEAGAYVSDGTTNYIATATSLKNADYLLDAQAKVNADGLSAEITDRSNADALKADLAGATLTGNYVFTSGSKVTGLPTPVDGDDAANKNYVDLAVQGLSLKQPVRVATTATDITTAGSVSNLVATAPATIDGVTLVAGDRVLVNAETEDAANGIYVFNGAGSAMTRTTDADATGELMSGAFLFSNEGTQYSDTGFVLVTDVDITLGTTPFKFYKATGAGQIIAGTGIAKDGNRLDINLGAGVAELPSDEVGIDVKNDGGLWTTVDGLSSSVDAAAQLAVKIDGTSLTLSASGIKVSDTFTGNVTALQSEVDTTQVGAGLETDGQYTADATTNYINTATSLKNADKLLDTQVKVNTDAIGTLASLTTAVKTDAVSAVNELDAEIGDLSTLTTTASTVLGALNELDSDVGDKATLITTAKGSVVAAINELAGGGGSTQDELDITQTGAGLETDGQYAADATTNYITAATSLKNADKLLDAQVKINETAIGPLASLTTTAKGSSVVAINELDSEIGNVATLTTTSNSTLVGAVNELDSEIGVLSSLTTTAKSTVVAAINELVSGDSQLRTDINGLNYTTTTAAAAMTHTITHGLAATYVDYTVLVEGDDGKYRNDIVAVTETDTNTLTVELTEARNVKIAVKKVASI
jgi:hypothetical protein